MARKAKEKAAEPQAQTAHAATKQVPVVTLGQSLSIASNDLGLAMAKTGKRPGDLTALQIELQRIIKQNHPLLDTVVK